MAFRAERRHGGCQDSGCSRPDVAEQFGDAKTAGSGVFERRIDFGPGYRLYFGRDGDTLVILLAGGTKKRQARDVEDAKQRWDDYKRRKKIEG